ncbi:MAG: hypothetical protein OHK0029_03560 [Armatimonadaceae bacterium]
MLQNMPFFDVLPIHAPAMAQGKTFASVVADLPSEEREVLAVQGILSVLLLPILVGGRFWGFIGFDNCKEARPWQQQEIAFLESVAAAIAQAQERRESDAKLRWQALHDPLTGLPNRAALAEQINRLIPQSTQDQKRFALLYFDLDNFKRINDTLGHSAGDILLVQVAKRLSRSLPRSTFLARMGGDEFVLVGPQANREGAAYLAEKALEIIRQPTSLLQYEVVTTASMGVSMFPEDGMSGDLLLRHADAAMFRAKEQGRNGYEFFTREMYLEARERFQLERDLRQAMIRDEFWLHYQPQFDLVTGTLYGAEVLARWEHPRRGTLMPSVFLQMVEEMGSAVPLGDFVLRSACCQAAQWQEQGLLVPVAVNISPRQFRETNLVRNVESTLLEMDLQPELLHLELTENILLDDAAATLETLQDLNRLGVGIAMDDFGTGYSSLSYLRRFPVDVVKIDQSFIRSLTESARDHAVVKAVIDLAHGLGMKVVGEGVETTAQRDMLAELGCDIAQGYLYSHPLSAPDFEKELSLPYR